MNQNALVVLPNARADLESNAAYLEEKSPGNAVKFFAATLKMFELLAEFPFLGALRPSPNSRLVWSAGFSPLNRTIAERHASATSKRAKARAPNGALHNNSWGAALIFYRPLASKDGIVVHQVLHRRRDAETWLEASLDDDSD